MRHPNAAAAGVSIAPAIVIIYLARLVGLDMSNEVAGVVSGAVIAGVLLVGREGLRGIASIVWRGRP